MAGFGRSISLPTLTVKAKRSGSKLRSISLPVRFHPIVANMNKDVTSLITWTGSIVKSPLAPWLLEGLERISDVMASLLPILRHPYTEVHLRESPNTLSISEDLLCLVDPHNSFRVHLIDFRQLQADTRAALRRRIPSRVASCIQAQSRSTRYLEKLAWTAQIAARTKPDIIGESLFIAICNAITTMASATSLVIIGLATLSDETIALVMPLSKDPEMPGNSMIKLIEGALNWRMKVKKESGTNIKLSPEELQEKAKNAAIEKFNELEELIKNMEIYSENISKDLVVARVSILNTISGI